MKGKLTITIGISGSGKSTWAHEQWSKDPKNTVLISRDKIRELLFGFGEKTIKNYYKRDDVFTLEKQVTRYEDTLINDGLNADKHVIVDATHLKRSYIERFKYWNVPTEIKTFSIEPVTAIMRDMKRDRQVGDEVIKRQYRQFKGLVEQLRIQPLDFTPVSLKQNKNLPPCIIFDIDGTLSHMRGRSPYDWNKVGSDIPDVSTVAVCDWINDLEEHLRPHIIICTGRDGIAEFETKRWLTKYGIEYDKFYIRNEKDSRPDWVIKEEIWREISKEFNIVGMFDDRLQVVRRARALGLKVFNVEYHNF